MNKKLIVLSPGHGGADPGAIGNGLVEKRVAWEICTKTQTRLTKNCDCRILQLSQTRPDCSALDDIHYAVSEANSINADYYFAVHINAGGGTGFESYIDNNPSQEEQKVQRITHSLLAYHLKPYGLIDRGMKRRNFYEVLKPKMPAVLYEFGFIDNLKDAELLKNPQFIEALANQLAYSINVACLI
jgi:N-acetylmuramoyl-L-alanine amidase